MPIKPLHLGPGFILKAVLGRRMSLTVFTFSQFTMDIEVIGRIAIGAQNLHGFTNTLLGATVILVPSVLLGRAVCRNIQRWLNSRLSEGRPWTLCVDTEITRMAAWTGGVLGVYSDY